MKGKLVNFLTKRTAAVMFALVLFMFGLFAWSMNEETAYAADYTAWDATTNSDFAVATYSESVAKTYVRTKAPTAEGYLFAGWFKDAACTEANVIMTASDISGTCYAKFVPEDVLSIKVQITNGDANTATTEVEKNMRFVSSVDTQTYLTVGFRMKYLDDNQNWTYKISKGTVVYERIVSATSGDEYKFSPKVVDTKSEYFMTSTWKGEDNTGIAEADFDTNYYVRAFWTTFDGVRVYGPTRYVSVNDGLNKNIVNMSVKDTTKVLDSQSLTASYVDSTGAQKSSSAVELYHDGTYAHLKVDLGSGVDHRSFLSSATKFTISNGATDVETIYRNLYTTHETTTTTANADSTWYSVYNAEDSSRKEFVIATSADLYGFIDLVNTTGNKCKGLTVYMVNDILANVGSASSVDGWVPSEGHTGYVWTPIDGFAGTFDGQKHTLKGLYMKSVSGITGIGFFTNLAGATIQNITIDNTSITVDTSAGTGTIAGKGYGTFKNIHTIAKYIDNEKGTIGGLVGVVTGNSTFNNCWNSSPITSTKNYVGGMFATVDNTGYTINVQHCLNSGNLSYGGTGNSFFGGMFGRANNASGTTGKVTVTDCLNVGYVRGTGGSTNYMGGLAGFGTNPSVATGIAEFKNSYSAINYASNGTTIIGVTVLVGAYDTGVTFTGITNDSAILKNDMLSARAFVNTSLNFARESNPNGYWVCREDDTPMLKTFVTGSDIVADLSDMSKNEFNLVDNVGYIYNKDQLDSFATKMQDSTFASQVNSNTVVYLMANITYNSGDRDAWVAGTTAAPSRVWTPIEGYPGTFEGQGHTIGGLYGRTVSGIAGYGLFTGTTATTVIRDLSITNSYYIATTSAGTGGLIGRGGGKIRNVLTDVVIQDTSAMGSLGGVVGAVSADLDIQNCYSKCDISTYYIYAGGILGNTANATGGYKITIINCLNSGNIMRADSGERNLYFGGIVGRTASTDSANWGGTLTVKYCLNVGMVDASKGYSGGILGYASGKVNDVKTTVINNCYAKQFVNSTSGAYSGATDIVGKWGADASQPQCAMIDADHLTDAIYACTYAKLQYWSSENTSGAWVLREGKTPTLKYYVGTDAYIDPIAKGWTEFTLSANGNGTINNLYQLKSFAEKQNAGTLGATSSSTITLGANIVVSKGNRNDWAAGKFVTRQTWSPIVNFPGTFNGQGNTISGLYIKKGSATGTGLFNATTTTAKIQKLLIKNAYVLAGNNAGTGAVIGTGAGLVWEVYADAIIDGNGANGRLGGIVGNASGDLKIKSCWNLGDVTSYNVYNGGILGNANDYVVDIEYCLNTGDVIMGPNTAITTANAQNGGIVGKAGAGSAGTSTGTINVTCCLNMGRVKSNHATLVNMLGGVAGYISGTTSTGAYSVKITNSYSALTYNSYNEFDNVKELVGGDIGKGGGITSSECIDYDLTQGQFAYYYMPLNYYSTSTTGGYWHAREGSHPIPEPFGASSGYTLITKFDVVATTSTPANFYSSYGYATSGGGTVRNIADSEAGITKHITATNANEFEAYATKLTSNGMLQYGDRTTITSASSSAGVNRFYTFVGRGVNVYLAYFAPLKTTRITIMPKTAEPLLGLRTPKLNSATDTVTPSVTQMQLATAGMMYVAQLADGKYVIVDGGATNGSSDVDEYDKERLYQYMLQYKPNTMEKPVIACWLVTHPDADHIQIPYSFLYNYGDKVELESMAYNFAVNFANNEGNSEATATRIANFEKYSTRKFPNVPHYIMHSGQNFAFKGMNIEILQTEEDYQRLGSSNTYSTWNYTSCAFKFKFNGGASCLFNGDYNPKNCDNLVDIYGSYLKSNIWQVPHHGLYGTTEEIAQKVNPSVVFISSLSAKFNEYHTTTYDWYTYLKSGSRTWYTNDHIGRVLVKSDGTISPQGKVTMDVTLP